ncbi:radical SAM protein [Rapidithrix thailandica]|uniref:Radical SAM protein n=1 Tax=Rapidithrix thailandica TaxID=413964 RepID=A0AAW9S5H3_9BACT
MINRTLKEEASPYTKIAQGLASHIAENSKPASAHVHLIKGAKKTQLFIPNGSRLYQITPETEAYLASLMDAKDEKAIRYELVALGLDAPALISDEPLQDPPLHALSLAIAQKCNMGCSYCYADQGDFGGPAKKMSLETAKKSIDLLINGRQKGDRVQLTFLGGEPLMNRQDLRTATEYAANLAARKQINIGFSITSNGSLVREEDARFFEEYGFAVTISLDGLKEAHDKLRPFKNGTGSFDRIMEKIKPLLTLQKNMQVSARVTVTPDNMNLAKALDEFIDMGFHSVGFSPLLKSSNGEKEMSKKDLEHLLAGMIECGLKFEHAALQNKRYPFLNMVNALKEIGKGTHRPYPCGAGAGYMGVSADGELAACHRFVNEPKGNMGTLDGGIDPALQNGWLAERHVHRQSPCNNCWARYLCGGSCHHEVIDKGRTACDYIRGWLHFAIQSYERINRLTPDWNK